MSKVVFLAIFEVSLLVTLELPDFYTCESQSMESNISESQYDGWRDERRPQPMESEVGESRSTGSDYIAGSQRKE